jgi:hypothetical protein
MIRWIDSLFGLEPVKQPVEQQSKAAQTYFHLIHHTQITPRTPWAINHDGTYSIFGFDTHYG